MKTLIRICLLVSLGLTTPFPLRAEESVSPPVPDPQAILHQRDQMIRGILEKSDTTEATIKEQLRELINGIMDFSELARRSLGSHWKKISPARREEFTRLFQELIELTSTKKLDIFKADRVEYLDQKIQGQQAQVKTSVYKGREQVEVIYLLHRRKGEWRVYDMIIDELGLAENYRTQFNQIIQESKFAGLLQRLRNRIQEEKAEASSPSPSP